MPLDSGLDGRFRLIHSTLRPARGADLADAKITDRQRIGVVFQAACLEAHLFGSGFGVCDWSSARVDSGGAVSGLIPEPVKPDDLSHQRLDELLLRSFRSESLPAGRGQGRRIAGELHSRWRESLAPIAAAQVVDELLGAAEFLWRPEFSASRRSLAAQGIGGGDKPLLFVVGPPGFRRAMLAGVDSLESLERRVAGNGLRTLWGGDSGATDVVTLNDSGRWRQAARLWNLKSPDLPGSPGSIKERTAFARSLYAVGRFEDVLDAVKGLRSAEGRLLRLWALLRLNRLTPAAREVDRLERLELTPYQRMQLTAAALRVFENRADRKEADRWLQEALTARGPEYRLRGRLLAAVNAWDRGSFREISEHLEAASEARKHARLRWRWHKAKGLEALSRGDGDGAVAAFSAALSSQRRRLTPFEAGVLWNELALGRSQTGDLAGAERAIRHSLRLHREVQGSRRKTFLEFNLAEIRLRRGRLKGVHEVLERAAREDRQARSWRSFAHDLELRVRYELARGRPHAALLRARDALDELTSKGVEWRVDHLRVLSARALGWLARPEAAAAELEGVSDEALGDMEAEELPALWALASDRERALASNSDRPGSRLWSRFLSGSELGGGDWEDAADLEPFRFGRLVFDLELLEPGIAPPSVLRRSIAALREAGAGPLAERLDQRDRSSWKAVRDYIEGSGPSELKLTRLFETAGYPEARLIFLSDKGEEVLVDGRGGEARASRAVEGGHLVLESPFVDSPQETILALIADSYQDRSTGYRSAVAGSSPLIGESPALLAVIVAAGKLANAEVPVMVLGETGTGKELLARYIHDSSPRAAGPFVPMNCAAVSEELLMSDLFGHVRGSFTGAVKDRAGVFETARAGTVFFDEIGDLPLRAQGFLLRVLQENEIRRVGESLPRKTDVRVVAATHRDLGKMVKDGTFRADLFYRLRVGSVLLPPLRDRGDDLLRLAEHFLRSADGRGRMRLSHDARKQIAAYAWPGNVRELKNILTVAVAYADGDEIAPEHLDLPYQTSVPEIGYHQKVLNFRRTLLDEALRAAGGNRAEAARRLGLTRQALSYLVRKLELDL